MHREVVARLDIPGIIYPFLIIGSIQDARDDHIIKRFQVSILLDAQNAYKRVHHPDFTPYKLHYHDTPTANVHLQLLAIYNLDIDISYDLFRDKMHEASDWIKIAKDSDAVAFVYCTHGNNESTVIAMAYLLIIENWTLERAYRYVFQKRPSSSPRRAYIIKLRKLEREIHGRVTLRLEQVGPSMHEIMRGLRGEPMEHEDLEESGSQVAESDERYSLLTNISVATMLHHGSSLRDTVMVTEEDSARTNTLTSLGCEQVRHVEEIRAPRRIRARQNRANCIIG